MPLVLGIIFFFSWLTAEHGFNSTLGGILSIVSAISIVAGYILLSKRTWLDIPEEY